MKRDVNPDPGPIEAPVVTGESVDRFIGMKAEGAKHVRRLRQQSREAIGLGAASRLSMGRRGTVTVELTPVFYLVQAERRWDKSFAQELEARYERSGISGLLRSKEYRLAMARLKSAVQAQGAAAEDLEAQVAKTVGTLLKTDPTFRRFAQRLHRISEDVASDMKPQITRTECRLVRFEGGDRDSAEEALVTLLSGDREELRLIPADLLRSAGVLEEGSAFVWTKMRFSPDNEASVITPAAFVTEGGGEELGEVAQRLRAAESPLPRPSPPFGADPSSASAPGGSKLRQGAGAPPARSRKSPRSAGAPRRGRKPAGEADAPAR